MNILDFHNDNFLFYNEFSRLASEHLELGSIERQILLYFSNRQISPFLFGKSKLSRGDLEEWLYMLDYTRRLVLLATA